MNNKLLIVDDDNDMLESLKYLLNNEGYDVRTASSGHQALRIFSDFDADVIISDMKMPGMSGLELLQNIIKINCCIQVIFLTGYATIKNVSDVMSHEGAFAYLQKPLVDFEMLYSTIRQAKEKQRLMTENLRWEERLKHSHSILEHIFENMDAIIYVADINTYELIYTNSKFKSSFGFSDNEKLTGKKCWEVLQKKNTGPCEFCTNAKLMDSDGSPLEPYTWELYNQTLDRWFNIKDQAVSWYDGRVVKLATAMDVTQIKEYEIRTKKSEARFRNMAELLPLVICETDADLILTYVNKKGFELSGYTDEDIAAGINILNMISPDEKQTAKENLSNMLQDNKKTLLNPRTLITKNGNKIQGLVKSSAVYNRDEHTGFMFTFLDMTQYNKMQKEVETANRFKAIGVLAGGIAHDLNNTLAAILGNVNLAQMVASASEADEYFDAAEKGVMQAKSLAEKLVGISRREAPIKKIMPISKIIKDITAQKGCFSDIRIKELNKVEDFNVEVDSEQIQTVLTNIILNASEAMDGKGIIDIELKKYKEHTHSGKYIVISISDTGSGISDTILEKVFDPYFTTKFPGKQRGTGLGLSIAYSIVKNHKGFIEIHSKQDQGTRVDVHLPIAG